MRGRARKSPGESTARAAPSYRSESQGSATSDLFGLVRVTDEPSLLERLKQLGADVYCDGAFATLSERLRHVIVREQLSTAVSGRDPAGKVETVSEALARVIGQLLVSKKPPRRSESNNQRNTEEV